MFVLVTLVLFQQTHSLCVQQGLCTDDPQVQDEIVDLHNELRREVSPSAQDMLRMSWSPDIANELQPWVDNCSLAHGPPSSRMLDGYELGENLFYSSFPESWTAVINSWHSEVQHYQYPTGTTNGEDVGHYTQVIWNSSYKVGCAVAVCPGDVNFYACRYFRAGNFQTWPPYTEGLSCGLCPNDCNDKLCTNPCPYINQFLNCPALVTTSGCNEDVTSKCPATCKCPTEIIPVYRK